MSVAREPGGARGTEGAHLVGTGKRLGALGGGQQRSGAPGWAEGSGDNRRSSPNPSKSRSCERASERACVRACARGGVGRRALPASRPAGARPPPPHTSLKKLASSASRSTSPAPRGSSLRGGGGARSLARSIALLQPPGPRHPHHSSLGREAEAPSGPCIACDHSAITRRLTLAHAVPQEERTRAQQRANSELL